MIPVRNHAGSLIIADLSYRNNARKRNADVVVIAQNTLPALVAPADRVLLSKGCRKGYRDLGGDAFQAGNFAE